MRHITHVSLLLLVVLAIRRLHTDFQCAPWQ